jgi:hypothetical protein
MRIAAMLKRITATVIVIALLSAIAVGADAAVRPGHFKGRTEQDARVSFRVLANKKILVSYSLEGAVLDCSSGRNEQFEGFTTSTSDRIFISARGRFGFTVDSDDGAISGQIKGTIKTGRATGTIRIVATINRQRELDPDGGIECDSDRITWKARR